jgi:hypothetical protein
LFKVQPKSTKMPMSGPRMCRKKFFASHVLMATLKSVRAENTNATPRIKARRWPVFENPGVRVRDVSKLGGVLRHWGEAP